MGLTSLESLDEFISVNRRNYEQHKKELANIRGIRLLAYDEGEKCNYQYIVLEIDKTVTGLGRDELVQLLWAENVIARRYFYPGCHRMEPYRSSSPHAAAKLPATEGLAERVLLLPTGTAIGANEISATCHIIRFVIEHGAEVSRMLQSRLMAAGATNG
jgi:dTDP-4-amino-4,6-dideoxygalactose transaminase